MEKKIVVPEFMLKAAYDAQLPADNPSYSWEESAVHTREFYRRILGAAFHALAEKPIVPEIQFCHDMVAKRHESLTEQTFIQRTSCEWQRRMFLAPEPEVPEEIRDLYEDNGPHSPRWKNAILEAFRRGQKAGPK